MEDLIQQGGESQEAPAQQAAEQNSTSPEGGQTPAEGGTGSGEQPKYDIEGFNQHFGSKFESESSLKEILDSSSKISDYESRLSTQENDLKAARERASKYDEFVDYFKPENFFGDEHTWKMVELRKKFPDKDPGVVQRIMDSGFNNLSDMDKLLLADKLKIPGNMTDDIRLKGALRSLNIETDDLSELTDIDKYTISKAVADQAETFNEIRNFKPDALKYDIVAEKAARDQERESQKTELQNKWKPLAESLLKNYKEAKAFTKNDKGEREQVFKYSADESFQKDFIEPLMGSIMNSGMEPTEENVQATANYIDQQYKILNFDRIVSEAVKYGRTVSAEAAHKEIHNDKPQNQNEAAPPAGDGQTRTLKEWHKHRISNKK